MELPDASPWVAPPTEHKVHNRTTRHRKARQWIVSHESNRRARCRYVAMLYMFAVSLPIVDLEGDSQARSALITSTQVPSVSAQQGNGRQCC